MCGWFHRQLNSTMSNDIPLKLEGWNVRLNNPLKLMVYRTVYSIFGAELHCLSRLGNVRLRDQSYSTFLVFVLSGGKENHSGSFYLSIHLILSRVNSMFWFVHVASRIIHSIGIYRTNAFIYMQYLLCNRRLTSSSAPCLGLWKSVYLLHALCRFSVDMFLSIISSRDLGRRRTCICNPHHIPHTSTQYFFLSSSL